jgi:hypothetical protein
MKFCTENRLSTREFETPFKAPGALRRAAAAVPHWLLCLRSIVAVALIVRCFPSVCVEQERPSV